MNRTIAYHENLVKLLLLRENMDMDLLIDNLYEFLIVEYDAHQNNPLPSDIEQQAVLLMIQHFQQKEEYEKCAVLKQLIINDSCNRNS
jgi:hypothetical protein